MPETLNNTEESQLLDAVKRAVDLVDQGHHPNDAIEKIARAEGFGPGRIKLAAHAYNNGRQLHQWGQQPNILDKLASFTLADPDVVIQRVYHGPTPAEKQAAERVDPDYHLPPTWLERPRLEKKARAPLPIRGESPPPYERDTLGDLHKAYGQVQRAKQAAEEASRQASRAEDRVRMKVAQLVTYFKQAGHARLPFDNAEYAARTYFGDATRPLLDMVYKQAHLREKRAGDTPPVLKQGIDLRAEPLNIVKEAVDAAAECHQLRQRARQAAEQVATVKEASFRPFANAGGNQPSGVDATLALGATDARAAAVFGLKRASWGGEVAAIAAGDVIGSGVHAKLNKEEEGEDDPLADVDAQNEINSVKNRVALDSMLTDPKNPLHKLPAHEVVQAYNELTKLTPHLADKPEALQPLLEAKFAGRLGTHQLNDAAALDHKLAQDKRAVLDLAAAGAGSLLSKHLGEPGKSKDDLVDDAWMDLESPHHHNELRKIKAHAMLNQLLTDPEDPISGHDVDRVLQAYNEISSAAPRVADSIHTLRPALRRKLEAHQEPFEAKELLDIEKGLAATKLPTPNTNILHDAPSKLLG